ncbi:MAG: hypothetical protein ACUVUP_04795 [Thermaceae bacterium]
MKVITFWVKPQSSVDSLPEAGPLLKDLLQAFYEYFPEYGGCLGFSQSPRRPRYLFIYTTGLCLGGLYPEAADYLEQILRTTFPGAEIRKYGKPWP